MFERVGIVYSTFSVVKFLANFSVFMRLISEIVCTVPLVDLFLLEENSQLLYNNNQESCNKSIYLIRVMLDKQR